MTADLDSTRIARTTPGWLFARVHAHHTGAYGWGASRILTVAVDAATPLADGWTGWTVPRGIKARWLVREPAQVHQLTRPRLRRRNNLMDLYHAAEEAAGGQIPPSAWHAYSDDPEAICHTIDPIQSGRVSA